MMTKFNSQSGFTLIEMMIVVAIIAIMSAMLAPTLFNQVNKAEKARTASDIRQIESALKFYRLDNYRYPSQAEGLEALVSAPSGASAGSWNGPYLDSLPKDAWKEPYRYSNPGTHGKPVEVYTLGADRASGGTDSNADLGSWNIND
ncbi:type II secretion system major pseudopilin GspG [Gammaproteobacteria bacterium]|jgi:general secretion pathway protein G|nr:type II secretion system major pseudopilin GspG [Gammaproteobacteria bacterium]